MNNTCRHTVSKILIPILALLSLFCIASFLRRIDFFADAGQKLAWPYWLAVVIVIPTSGIGLSIPFLLWFKREESWPILLSLIFSLCFLALQIYLAIVPNLSSCNCASYSEAILGIKDWYVTEPALGLMTANVFILLLGRKSVTNNTADDRIAPI